MRHNDLPNTITLVKTTVTNRRNTHSIRFALRGDTRRHHITTLVLHTNVNTNNRRTIRHVHLAIVHHRGRHNMALNVTNVRKMANISGDLRRQRVTATHNIRVMVLRLHFRHNQILHSVNHELNGHAPQRHYRGGTWAPARS